MVDWPTQHGLSGTSVSPDTGVSGYAGNGTIDLSVLGGGGVVSPSRVDLLELTYWSSTKFMPPSGTGKGKGNSRAVAMDGVVDSPGEHRGFFKYEASSVSPRCSLLTQIVHSKAGDRDPVPRRSDLNLE